MEASTAIQSERVPKGGKNKIHRTTRMLFDSDYLHNESGPFLCVKVTRSCGAACLHPWCLAADNGSCVLCCMQQHVHTEWLLCLFTLLLWWLLSSLPTEGSLLAFRSLLPGLLAQTWVCTGCGSRHHQSFMSACHKSLHFMFWRKLL